MESKNNNAIIIIGVLLVLGFSAMIYFFNKQAEEARKAAEAARIAAPAGTTANNWTDVVLNAAKEIIPFIF